MSGVICDGSVEKGSVAGSVAELLTEDLMIESDTSGIRLHLRHKRLAKGMENKAETTLLLVHGATFASGSLFDVPFEGVSLLDLAVTRGYDVYALDIRGYGGSTRPFEMERPAEENSPIVRTETAVRDLHAAVLYLLDKLKIEQVNLMAMSWGGSVAGAYTAEHNDKIRKLALVAPLWLSTKPLRIAGGDKLGAYRKIPLLAAKAGWMEGVPEEKRKELLPAGWFEQWMKAALADDPQAERSEAPMVHAPSGAVQDVRDFWLKGKKLYEPRKITVPVLLLRAAWDADVSLEMARDLFLELTGSSERRWMELAEGTHLVLLERNRERVLHSILSFLEE